LLAIFQCARARSPLSFFGVGPQLSSSALHCRRHLHFKNLFVGIGDKETEFSSEARCRFVRSPNSRREKRQACHQSCTLGHRSSISMFSKVAIIPGVKTWILPDLDSVDDVVRRSNSGKLGRTKTQSHQSQSSTGFQRGQGPK